VKIGKKVLKYYIVISCISLSVIVLVSLVLYSAHQEAISLVKEQFNEQQRLLAKQTSIGIEEDIRFLARELELLSRKSAIKKMDVKRARAIMEDTFEYVKKLHVNDIGLIDSMGIIRLPLKAPHLTGKDFSFREYFKEAKLSKAGVPTYEFISFKGVDIDQKGIVIAMPIFRREKEFGGVVLFTIKAHVLIKGFIPIETVECLNCEFWALDSNKIVLYHPRSKPGTHIEVPPDADIAYKSFLENVIAGRDSVAEYVSPDGRRMLAASHPVEIANQKWAIVIGTPAETVTGLLRKFNQRYIAATLFAFIAIISVSIIIVYLINRWNVKLQDEITERMTAEDELRNIRNGLEQRVKQRTVELEEINEMLQREIAEKEKTSKELRVKSDLIKSTLESLTHPFYVIDANDYTVKLANPASHFGDFNEGHKCYELTHKRSEPCDPSEHPCTVVEIKKTKKPVTLEHTHYDSEGNPIFLEVHGYPIFDGDGNVTQVIEYNLDITSRKISEQKIIESLKEKEVLLREVHHRVKNNMQVISSLLNLQSEYVKDSQYIGMFHDSRNRIRSMALIHEKLYQSEDLTNIDFNDYISSLSTGLFMSHGMDADRMQLIIDAGRINLGIDLAIPCGLIINELVTNSLKHAFPDGRKGKIEIILEEKGDEADGLREYRLKVSDNGVGIPEDVDLESAKTLGLHLVTTLVEHQLQGIIELKRAEGTSFNIYFSDTKSKKSNKSFKGYS
jgi:two-component sensor histidine kinase